MVLFTYFRSQIPRIYLLIPEANINELHMAVACPHGRPKIGEMALELALFNTFPTVYHKPWLGYIYIVVFPAQRYIGYRLRLLYTFFYREGLSRLGRAPIGTSPDGRAYRSDLPHF